MCSALVWAFLYFLAVSCFEKRSTNADEVLAIIVIIERTVHKRSWGVCIGCIHNKRELYINIPGEYVLSVVIIRENCT
jgi:hypothetical protein